MKNHFKKSKRLNPVFSSLKLSNNPTYALKTDENHQKYFLKKIPKAREKIEFINQELWDIIDQHISIYEEYNDKYYYIAAYHFTITLAYRNDFRKVHCYFNARAIYQTLTIKKQEEYQGFSSDLEKRLKDYAELCALNIFAELQKSLENRCLVLRELINTKEKSIENLSHNIVNNLQDYIKKIDQLIPLLEEIDELGEYNRPKIEIYRKILSLYSEQKESKKSMAQEVELSDDPISPEIDNRKLTEPEHSSIIHKKEKNADLTKKEFNELIQNLQKMKASELDKESLMEKALQGDEKAMQEFLDRNFLINHYSYFCMAVLGNKKFFEKAYERSPINLNVLLIENRDRVNNGLTFLSIAYGKRNFDLFEYLLQKGANPNVSFLNGERLIHHISENGELRYAECLLKYYPLTDISSFSALDKEVMTYYLTPNFKALQKVEQHVVNNCLHNNVSNTSPVTPLMVAACYRQEEMVKFLLESKANPLLEHKNNTLMEMATTCQTFEDHKSETLKKLNPNIILMFLRSGMKVDSLFYRSGVSITGLYNACEEGDLDAVKILIENFGADVNFTTSKPDIASFLGNLKLSPLFIAIAGIIQPKNINNASKFKPIVDYLMDQDFVPLKMSILNQVVNYKNFLCLSEKIKKKIQSNKDKINFLIKANQAYNDKQYETSVSNANNGLKLSVNHSQYREQLLKVIYLSYYELGMYPNSGLFCAYYLKWLKLKLEKILDPGIQDKLNKDYDQGEKMFLKIKQNIGKGADKSFFDKISESKDDAEFKHLAYHLT